MEARLLSSLGRAAGLAGVGLGVFVLLFQGVLQKEFLPKAGLGSGQAFAVIMALMILTFGIASIGMIAWLLSRNVGPRAPVPAPALGILSVLIVVVLGSTMYVAAQAKPDPPIPPATAAAAPPSVAGSITADYRVCIAGEPGACPPGAVHLGCGAPVGAWAQKACASYSQSTVEQSPGSMCEYRLIEIKCAAKTSGMRLPQVTSDLLRTLIGRWNNSTNGDNMIIAENGALLTSEWLASMGPAERPHAIIFNANIQISDESNTCFYYVTIESGGGSANFKLTWASPRRRCERLAGRYERVE